MLVSMLVMCHPYFISSVLTIKGITVKVTLSLLKLPVSVRELVPTY